MIFSPRKVLTIGLCVSGVVNATGCQREVSTVSPAEIANTPTESTTEHAPVLTEKQFELEPGFELLSRDQFDSFSAEADTWTATSDGVVCSGKPRGYLYSKQPYENFTLRLEYRFSRPEKLKDESKFKGNTGFLVYISGEHKLWPVCLEVQGKHLQIAAIKENGGADPIVAEDNDAARQAARKSVGEWNAIEIVSKAGAIQVFLNDVLVCTSKPGVLTNGLIGIQSEDFPFEVRRMRIRTE